jgi:hypothetical protein
MLLFEETGEGMDIFRSFHRHVLVSAVMLFALSSLPATVQGQWGGAPPLLPESEQDQVG